MDSILKYRNRQVSKRNVQGMLVAIISFALALQFQTSTAAAEDQLQLQPKQQVMIVGNTFAERMALYGYFESALYCAYPDHELTVRNLGWSGDEVDLMPRADNTGTFEENLTWHKTDVVFLCFGMNESFAGQKGLGAWRERLTKFITGLKTQKFNGTSAPRLVLISPTAHEDLGAPLPTGKAIEKRNADLSAYTQVMSEVAKEQEVLFVDLFAPMKAHMESTASSEHKLTVNGIHLNELGYYHASRAMAESLGIVAADATSEGLDAEEIRRAIYEKNHLYHLCWRPLNPYYIWGGRAWCWEADEPMTELEQIGALVRLRDAELWKMEKPPVATVWGKKPSGAEIWETPVQVSAEGMPEKGNAPKMESVRRNGARPKR